MHKLKKCISSREEMCSAMEKPFFISERCEKVFLVFYDLDLTRQIVCMRNDLIFLFFIYTFQAANIRRENREMSENEITIQNKVKIAMKIKVQFTFTYVHWKWYFLIHYFTYIYIHLFLFQGRESSSLCKSII